MIASQNPPILFQAGPRKILVLLAVEAEYGPALRQCVTPVITGVGPIEAALSTMRALQLCHAADQRPDYVLSIGSAGSPKLVQGEIYQVTSVSYRDMDASPLGFVKGETPFLGLPAELPLPLRLPGLPVARCSSGGGVISGEAYRAIDADLVEMETFSILRACQHFGLPLIGLRGISDGDKDLQAYEDWTALLGVIDEKLAAILARFPDLLQAAERARP